ncbi:Sodium/hydrogen exchanger [Corynespora cassiicola Philippines]|uniref:Sodium/hydrogen exchanger n=1 Tax=Corynespora cassiicola Philippines TaxID=1448308 RepID=A0A2T2P0H8_CORCC|nr:Sodium/hydrogen exchanger [Corynespora cassiicola Philippines]
MALDTETAPSLPYHEPGIITILVQASFLLLLNLVNAALDRLLYCGLLGQVFLGIAWGTPGAKWLSTHVEEVIVQLGYLGLLLLVYEGGLSTSFKSLKANLLLSSGVALTGIALPISLSYSLQRLLDATPLQAFAAGAALCSTSLGTTFTVLGSSGLSSSRLGVVLTSAAMMDDVVGLVMVQVISNLGGDGISATTVLRPVLVSLAFAVTVPLACRFLVKPVTLWLNHHRSSHPDARPNALLSHAHAAFAIHTSLLVALIAGATYAGTSNLFAAYIAGATISWWDSELPHPQPKQASPTEQQKIRTDDVADGNVPTGDVITAQTVNSTECVTEKTPPGAASTLPSQPETTGAAVYHRYYHQAVSKILQPFFFASIGFSIPITRMFRASIVWRGIVYTVLMTLAKMACGLWLVRFSLAPVKDLLHSILTKIKLPSMPHFWGKNAQPADSARQSRGEGTPEQSQPTGTTAHAESSPQAAPSPPRPLSLHPPLILALAMTARGEIGFLISSVAESRGVFASADAANRTESDMFLVVTWAIVLCTILGPLGVGLSVRRVKKMEEKKNSEREGTGRDVLGVWGVE